MFERETRARVVSPSAQLGWLALLLGGFVALGFGGLTPAAVPIGLGSLGVALFALFTSGKLARSKVRVDDAGVHVDGRLVEARSDLKQAYFVPAGREGPHVRVNGKQWTAIGVDRDEEAASIVAALGMDVGSRAATFSAVAHARGPTAVGMALGLAILVLGMQANFLPLSVLGGIVTVLAPILFVPAKVHVGTDGILHTSRLRSDFHAYDDIERVVPTGTGIALHLRGGRAATIATTSRFSLTALERQERDALLERIREAIVRRATSAPVEARVGWRLDRGERPIGEWLDAMDRGEEGFREAALRIEDLAAVLDDRASATARERLAAAVVLAKRGTDDERARVRVAAETTVAPKLRVALATIAEGSAGDRAKLEAAIREAEEEEEEAATVEARTADR